MINFVVPHNLGYAQKQVNGKKREPLNTNASDKVGEKPLARTDMTSLNSWPYDHLWLPV